MQIADRSEAVEMINQLCAAFDRPQTPEVHEAFLTGCRKLPLRLFRLGIEHALEHHEGRCPNPKTIARYAYEAKAEKLKRERNAEQARQLSDQGKYPQWLRAVNGLFLKWTMAEIMSKQRKVFGAKDRPRSIPDAELIERRAACRRLAEDFELMECDGDPQATHEWLKQAFDTQMALIRKQPAEASPA